MRILTEEINDAYNNPDSSIYKFLHTKPDYSILEKESAEFAEWIQKEHEEDKRIMMEALQTHGRL